MINTLLGRQADRTEASSLSSHEFQNKEHGQQDAASDADDQAASWIPPPEEVLPISSRFSGIHQAVNSVSRNLVQD